jgi:hypothetical protein
MSFSGGDAATPEQLDLLVSPQDRAKPWRVAAETAASNPYLSEREREYNARYYIDMADKIERGEA